MSQELPRDILKMQTAAREWGESIDQCLGFIDNHKFVHVFPSRDVLINMMDWWVYKTETEIMSAIKPSKKKTIEDAEKRLGDLKILIQRLGEFGRHTDALSAYSPFMDGFSQKIEDAKFMSPQAKGRRTRARNRLGELSGRFDRLAAMMALRYEESSFRNAVANGHRPDVEALDAKQVGEEARSDRFGGPDPLGFLS